MTADEPIALCFERSPELAVGVLAALKTGGSYLPLDPAYPTERLAFMAGDAGVRFLLTAGSAASAGNTTSLTNFPAPPGSEAPDASAITRLRSGMFTMSWLCKPEAK